MGDLTEMTDTSPTTARVTSSTTESAVTGSLLAMSTSRTDISIGTTEIGAMRIGPGIAHTIGNTSPSVAPRDTTIAIGKGHVTEAARETEIGGPRTRRTDGTRTGNISTRTRTNGGDETLGRDPRVETNGTNVIGNLVVAVTDPDLVVTVGREVVAARRPSQGHTILVDIGEVTVLLRHDATDDPENRR